jgi:hypothetical protein
VAALCCKYFGIHPGALGVFSDLLLVLICSAISSTFDENAQSSLAFVDARVTRSFV